MYNKCIQDQLLEFERIIRMNSKLMKVLVALDKYSKINPNFKDYYIGAGSVNQTIFNYLSDKEIDYGIKDFDIVYFDSDLSYEAEDKIIKDLTKMLEKDKIEFDIKNEARVHLWYNEKHDNKRDAYTSTEDAISKWGATVTCIGIRLENDKLITFCPYGLSDVFSMTIRPVKTYFTKELYDSRCQRWLKKWPNLNIIPWDEVQ